MNARTATCCLLTLLCPPAIAGQPTTSGDQVRVGFARGAAYDTATLPLEPYVARVLGGEAAPNTPPAALEALAIAVRTYAAANRGRHRAQGFDVCDQVHCQVVRTANPATEQAARATAGRVLLDRGRAAVIYYSASCGGRSEVPSAVWPGSPDPPFMPTRTDEACEGWPEWTIDLTAADITRALNAAGYKGSLRNLRIGSRNRSRRVAMLRIDGMQPSTISGQDFRMAVGRMMGPLVVRSLSFEMKKVGPAWRLSGHGYGHGVGMCVIGSMNLATKGQSAQAILARYFPGLTVGRVP